MTAAERFLADVTSCLPEDLARKHLEAVQEEAVEVERERIRQGVRISRSSMPIFAHVDSYGLGQVLQGKPWPTDR